MSRMTPRMQARLFLRLLLLQATWSFERMQGIGFAHALEPWLETLYPEPEELRRACERHCEYFNTQPYVASLVAGVVCAMEESAAAAEPDKKAAAFERLAAVKKAMGSALAGLGDSFFWGVLRPAAAAFGLLAALAAARAGTPLAGAIGAAVYVLVYNAPTLALRWRGLALGYEWREQTPVRLKELDVQSWIRVARRVGMVAAVALVVFTLGSTTPEQQMLGVASIIVFLGLYRVFSGRATAMRLYTAVCLLGILSTAAGWP